MPGSKPEEVAVKFIKWATVWHGFWRDPEQEELVRRELKTLMVLDNPFIIRVREWFEARSGIYFVQELCDGGSLQDFLDSICREESREVRMQSYERLRSNFRQMTYALQYLHQMDPPIAHCDLKPENVLFKTKDPDSCIRLIDFGLVSLQEADECIVEKWTKGTQIFMAPEQFLQADGAFNPQMDVWALGVIFCWIITALELGSLQHPVLDEDEGKGFEPHFMTLYNAYRDFESDAKAGGEASWRRELFRGQPESAVSLADKMLVLDASRRWSTRSIMHHDWTLQGDKSSTELMGQESVVMNMRMYPKLDKFEKWLLNLVAGHISGETGEQREIVLDLRRAFRSLDTSGDGRLSKDELLDGLRDTWGASKSEAELELLEAEIDDLFEELSSSLSGSCDQFRVCSLDQVVEESEPASSPGRCLSSRDEAFEEAAGRTPSSSYGPIPFARAAASWALGEGGSSRCSASSTQSALIGANSRKNRSTISYTEFIAAAIGSQMLSSEENLIAAFHELDAMLTGAVSREDLEGTIGMEAAERVLFELDKDEMSYEDFKKLAERVAQKRWGIVPVLEEDGADSPHKATGIRPMKTLSGSSFRSLSQDVGKSLRRGISFLSGGSTDFSDDELPGLVRAAGLDGYR